MNRRRFLSHAATIAAVLPFAGVSGLLGASLLELPQRSFKIVNSYPHDPEAFTQGLIFHDGDLYESTGGWGTSSLRQVELETGRVLRKRDLPGQYFGEGLTLWRDRLIQLTWTTGIAFVYDVQTFQQTGSFSYGGEGWGLTHDGQRLLLSDGSDILRSFDPETYQEIGRVNIVEGRVPVTLINELEYVHGQVWANIFTQDIIAQIDPLNGNVVSWLDFSGMFDVQRRISPEAVLNGITCDSTTGRIFVTGKLWPRIYELSLNY